MMNVRPIIEEGESELLDTFVAEFSGGYVAA